MHFKWLSGVILLIILNECTVQSNGQLLNVPINGIGIITGIANRTAWTNQTMYQFLGVKYALPPSGERRFRKPVPIPLNTNPNNVIDATKPGISCPYYDIIRNLTQQELMADLEDCLHLSIYTKNISANFPVMIFIHGGALENGNSELYKGNYLLERDVVFVAIQYRLAPLGFMTTQSDGMPGNLGFEDVIHAIEWVKQYINNFGGNGDRITVFGESAGSLLTSALVLSDQVPETLFQRAILQSGTYFSPWGFTEQPIENARAMARFANCPANGTIEAINICFRGLPVLAITKAYNDYNEERLQSGKTVLPGAPLVKNTILPLSPSELVLRNEPAKNIDIMAGVTSHDGLFMANVAVSQINSTVGLNDTKYNSYQLIDKFLDMFGVTESTGTLNGFLESVLFSQEILQNGRFNQMLSGLKDIANVVLFKAPTLRSVQHHARHHANRTYLYSFDYVGQHSLIRNQLHPDFQNGVHHADELAYIFPMKTLNRQDTEVAKKIIDLWTSFAIDGVPKANGVPAWRSVTKFTGPYLKINERFTIAEDFLNEYDVVTRSSGVLTVANMMLLILSTIFVVNYYY